MPSGCNLKNGGLIYFRLWERNAGKVPCCLYIVTDPAVIAEVFDEAYEVGKCARHERFLFFSNDFVLCL
jgi:hypothetical protein